MSNRTAEYRITLSRLIAVPAPVEPLPRSISYPDRHRRTDKQIALATIRFMAGTLVCVAIAIGIAAYMGVL